MYVFMYVCMYEVCIYVSEISPYLIFCVCMYVCMYA